MTDRKCNKLKKRKIQKRKSQIVRKKLVKKTTKIEHLNAFMRIGHFT